MKEILARGAYGNCVKTREGGATITEEQLRGYLAGATVAEHMIGDRSVGQRVWVGTLEGVARSFGSTEVVVSMGTNTRSAYIVMQVPEVSDVDIDAPVGSLAAVQILRLDAPQGASVPPGAELWLFTGNLIASMSCK